MEKSEKVKQEVIELIMHNLGKPAAAAFESSYGASTMPIFFDSAYSILSDMIGTTKANQQMNTILTAHSMKGLANAR
jgi:hypothetical protein